jgi:voltage-gated potassium channel
MKPAGGIAKMVAHQVAVHIGLRHRLYAEMEPSARSRPGLSRTNMLIVGLVLASFIVFALETEPDMPPGAAAWISALNIVILIAFAIEYVVRLWVIGEDPRYRGLLGRVRYIFTPFALADLAAFLPELLWLSFAHPGANDQTLMFLRVIRLVRLIKIARFIPAFEVLGAAMRRAGMQLVTALALALMLVYVSAVALYFIEGVGEGRQEFASIVRSVWWSVATLTTVGYGDIYPITVGGRIAASIIAIAGIGVVALPAGIFASAFSDELRDREARRKVADVQPPSDNGPTSGP